MDDNLDKIISRRSFLRRGACAALGLGGITSQLFTMRSMGAMLDATAFNDYKAMVCIFLFGGNDNGNTLIPYDNGDENYETYAQQRTTLAMPKSALANTVIAPENTMGRRFALHPVLTDVKDLFDSGNISILSNVGTLLEPLTKFQYTNKTGRIPSQLFAHNVQQEQWQLSRPNATDGVGWGGTIADALQSLGANLNSNVSMNISLAGQSIFMTGRNVASYGLGRNGPSLIDIGQYSVEQEAQQAFMDMVAVHQDPTHPASSPMSKVLADISNEAVMNSEVIEAIANQYSSIDGFPVPTDNRLAEQLRMVARMIYGRDELSHKRQIFFVSIGGFDNHDSILGETIETGNHARQLKQVNDALAYFWNCLNSMGMQNRVTTFTASDFGRTMRSNGNGSDHGWGSHHFIMGGDHLAGKRIFGEFPSIVLGGLQDTRNGGQYIPTTSVDAYGFELAKWMGVPYSEMDTVFPHISRFLDIRNPDTHLGFLQQT